MTEIVCLHAKDEIEAFTRGNVFLHIYSIGDLDDFFWPYTIWHALRQEGRAKQVVLLYTGCAQPNLVALTEEPVSSMRDLVRGLVPVLPRRSYAHISPGIVDVLADDYCIESHGAFHKMGLMTPARLADVDVSETVPLGAGDTAELMALYEAAYPRNFFVPRMLETGRYFGVRRGGVLASVAGVHVYAPTYRVAAIGNVATRPDARGQGLATAVTARLCRQLLSDGIEHIGLNVNADNRPALSCYEKLGFARVADYGEYSLELKRG